jgi:hypothetical protein
MIIPTEFGEIPSYYVADFQLVQMEKLEAGSVY